MPSTKDKKPRGTKPSAEVEFRIEDLSPEVRELVGIIPADFDMEAERAAYLEEKYGPVHDVRRKP